MRVLSIDFDYFVDADLKTRNGKFPPGGDGWPAGDALKAWDECYARFPELKYTGVIPRYADCLRRLSGVMCGSVTVAESHADILKMIDGTGNGARLELLHFDFHHDYYISGGHKPDCANWLRFLMGERPSTKVCWGRRTDSDTRSLDGEFPYPSTTDFEPEGTYDAAFLCFSPEWTPPHLRPEFEELCSAVKRANQS